MKNTLYIVACMIFFSACDSFLDSELPNDQTTFEEGIQTVEDLEEMLNSVYDVVANSFAGQAQKFAEALGEDVFMEGNTGTLLQVYNRSSDFFNGEVGGFYKEPYIVIFRANTLIEEIERVSGVTPEKKDRIIGEAKAMRALAHLELVKLFAQPYGYTADNSHPGIVLRRSSIAEPEARSSVAEVYEFVIQDLLEAKEILPLDNGFHLDRSDVSALLARTYFYQNDFQKAYDAAQEAITSSGLELGPIGGRYIADQAPQEALFYIISTGLEDRRSNGFRDVFGGGQSVPALKASSETVFLINEFPEDKRITLLDTLVEGNTERVYYSKYTEEYFNVTLLSLSEMYLIAAESLIELDRNIDQAVTYINAIKTRAGVPTIVNSGSKSALLSEVRKERRKEFAGEGINLFDLKRRGANGENIFIRNAPWDCPGLALQFPASEITVKGFELNEEGGCN